MRYAQAALVLVILAMLLLSVRQPSTTRAMAARKLAFIGLAMVIVTAVLMPDQLTLVANWVGIGRGADLVMYLVAIGFLFFALHTYLKFAEYERRLTELTRALALHESAGDDDTQ